MPDDEIPVIGSRMFVNDRSVGAGEFEHSEILDVRHVAIIRAFLKSNKVRI